jgi:hypothetical protein
MVDMKIAAQMRRDGATLQEIADVFGVKYQRIQYLLKKGGVRNGKRDAAIEKIPYEGLYQFMVANPNLSLSMLSVIMVGDGSHTASAKIRRFAHGENCSLSKRAYDKLLELTGMTYEQLFKLREGFTEADLEGGNGDG